MITFVGGKTGMGWQIYILNDDGSNIRTLTENIQQKTAMFFTPIGSKDGKYVVFTLKDDIHSSNRRICTVPVDDDKVRYLTPPEGAVYALRWLPSGFIVYNEQVIRPYESDGYICTMNSDGEEKRRIFHYSMYRKLTFTKDSYQNISISMDGTKIAMTSWRDDQIYVVRAGMPPLQITQEKLKIKNIAWSPDDSMIAFSAVRSPSPKFENLFVANNDGTKIKPVCRVIAETDFAFSSDNQYIAIVNQGKREYIIEIINMKNSEKRKISNIKINPESGNKPNCPIWSNDNRYIIYTTFMEPYMHLYRFNVETNQHELLVGDDGGLRDISYISSF